MEEKIDDTRCAPNKKYSDCSCFEHDELIKIAVSYNEHFPEKQFKIPKTKCELVEILQKKLEKKCDNQVCWLKQRFIKSIQDQNIKQTFRPIGPSKKNEWLSTTDIDKVMEQYHSVYQDFLYLGTFPSDFMELDILGMKNLDFDDLINKGKTRLGMVINLDEHNQSGSHWVALFVNLKKIKNKYQIYYFDSFGGGPLKKIKYFINMVVKYLIKKEYNVDIPIKYLKQAFEKKNKLSKNIQHKLNILDMKYNTIQHQIKNSECGVYSMNFILRLLKGETFEDITNNVTRDDKMEICREVYFNNYSVKI